MFFSINYNVAALFNLDHQSELEEGEEERPPAYELAIRMRTLARGGPLWGGSEGGRGGAAGEDRASIGTCSTYLSEQGDTPRRHAAPPSHEGGGRPGAIYETTL